MNEVLFQRLHPDAQLPQQAHHDDAGHDLHATESVRLAPGARAAVGCGFAMALPATMAALVVPRSGLALKEGLSVLNAPGLIDAGYRGELISAVDTTGVYGSHDIHYIWGETLGPIKKFDRYFQICAPDLAPFMVQIIDSEDALGATARGAGGFGSTGI